MLRTVHYQKESGFAAISLVTFFVVGSIIASLGVVGYVQYQEIKYTSIEEIRIDENLESEKENTGVLMQEDFKSEVDQAAKVIEDKKNVTPPSGVVKNNSDVVGVSQLEILDCGSDLNCIANAAKSCTTAKARIMETRPIFASVVTVDSYMEIKLKEDGTCRWYQKIFDYKTELKEDVRSSLSPDELLDQEEASEEAESMIIGKDQDCIFANGQTLYDKIYSPMLGGNISISYSSRNSHAENIGAISCTGSMTNIGG